jgi:hypothetical protein
VVSVLEMAAKAVPTVVFITLRRDVAGRFG